MCLKQIWSVWEYLSVVFYSAKQNNTKSINQLQESNFNNIFSELQQIFIHPYILAKIIEALFTNLKWRLFVYLWVPFGFFGALRQFVALFCTFAVSDVNIDLYECFLCHYFVGLMYENQTNQAITVSIQLSLFVIWPHPMILYPNFANAVISIFCCPFCEKYSGENVITHRLLFHSSWD